MQLPEVSMREQEPNERSQNFDEVPYGYNEEEAQKEAIRCLECPKAPCVFGCPVKVEIKEFIDFIILGDFNEALAKIRETNSLPAICGRVCPQETQCQAFCTLGKGKQKPVAIGRLERFVADWGMKNGKMIVPQKSKPTGHKIAIVGAGPAGLTAAGDLSLLGHQVKIFEAFGGPGGVLLYGIPEFRLPKNIIDYEVEYLKKLGVEFEFNCLVGKTVTIQELMEEEEYKAVFIGTGAGLPYFMEIPGEDLVGVFSANEFLTRSNMMRAFQFPEYDTPLLTGKKAVIVGGGNVAMDSARTALRLGYEDVRIVYRRSEEEMPARSEEIEHAKEEGIKFELLTLPLRYLGDQNGRLKGADCIRMKLGEPDQSGRRRPIPIEGSEFLIEADLAIVAIGGGSNPILVNSTPGLKTDRKGRILADKDSGLTTLEGVYAGGDIVTGSATVIEAMGAGKRAALAIHNYLLNM
ncbi:glutamate synthase (NADPH), homotetrameric [bacterium B13(2017)]|nr:glutamate synthase (NADPH), homotetrameric [bacterium B13(2017)]